jgi:acyl-CoA dehydrogenase
MNAPFQNGPIRGKNVFIPLDAIIGGQAQAGNGWRMLMDCLSAGRAISLPSTAMGGARVAALTTGAYSRIRRQFGLPVCAFEGIQEAIARIVGYTYTGDAARLVTVCAIDHKLKPSIASAIVKYHSTELGRQIGMDAMDVHAGKGLCLGPNNYIGRSYQAAPIAITVEGANILTRSMIIFGQGAVRCHPFAMTEMHAVSQDDLHLFDQTIYQHIGYILRNAARSIWLGLTFGRFSHAPKTDETAPYYRWINRFSASLALLSDVSMITLGGELKRKEGLSARLGDVLSYLYLGSAVLKHYADRGSPKDELPVVRWSVTMLAYKIQTALVEFLQNFPIRPLAWLLYPFVLPLGKRYSKPSDALNKEITRLVSKPSAFRERLLKTVFHGSHNNIITEMHNILDNLQAAEPLENLLKQAIGQGTVDKHAPYKTQLQMAVTAQVLTGEEATLLNQNYQDRLAIIQVDAFKPEVLFPHAGQAPVRAVKPAKPHPETSETNALPLKTKPKAKAKGVPKQKGS